MLQRLPIALSLIKAGNISENVLYVIQKIIHFWYRAKEITQKVYKNITNSIKI